MVRGAINIKLTIEEKVPPQKKINVSLANQKRSSSTCKCCGGSSSKVTKTSKAGFVEGSSGRAGYKGNATYKSTRKVNDKVHSGEIRKSSCSTYKKSGGSSSRVTKKAGVFVDGRSGCEEYREEANYKSSYKVNGKAHSGEIRKSSSTYKCKAGDGRSGREEYREEANYKSSYKVNGKGHGVTTEFETSVKCKKTTTYDNSNKYLLGVTETYKAGS
ncbi:uncharacterized protein LOC132602818 isoform X2 [Lycium barbarum]|uniref:uncharacterized protein LOC132602818 isoform X2 n=1 Tax=Lycium barbarum TaxID=112863 RepID=UPI00293E7C5C|nr:uncharacterized protein LOC132602818 isoform X2 [Lycium barbarum]